MNKIVRSICLFTKNPSKQTLSKLKEIKSKLIANDFIVQTTRFCTTQTNILSLDKEYADYVDCIGVGNLSYAKALKLFDEFTSSRKISFTLDLTNEEPTKQYVDLLMKIIKYCPDNTFNFAYTFNNASSSPYFPSAVYERDGFSIGLQPTDLAENCLSLRQWLNNMDTVWKEVFDLFKEDGEFLGIDSSIAPIFSGAGSLINFVKKIGYTFKESCTTDIYTQITHYIKTHNPKPVGLCGLMLPCLEDFELADEYEKGNFPIQTNIFLSLHSGLGIDTYPIGVDENPEDIIDILRLTRSLSLKFNKPLSIRFVSDGKSKVGEKTNFGNQYLKDVVIRPLVDHTP